MRILVAGGRYARATSPSSSCRTARCYGVRRSRTWGGRSDSWRGRCAASPTTWQSSAAGPAGLATAVYGASEGLSILVLEAATFGGQAGASARIENYLGFPSGVPGQALMGRAFAQAQKFGAEFSLATEVKRLDCTSERSGPDPVLVLHLGDGRRVRARAGGRRDRRALSPAGDPNLAAVRGARGVSYWASPVEARLCRGEDVALIGGGNSAGQAAVFLSSHARAT